MELDRAVCERAMLSRDARFDGRFFIGVLTTGIYCRPICPVRQPQLENVRFFRTAAAAAETGLRPCLRCRPEASPGTPAGSCFRLPYRPPFDWEAVLAFLAPRATPGVESVSPQGYRRTISVDGHDGLLDVARVAERNELELSVELADPAALVGCVDRVRRIFDLDAVPQEIADHLRCDRDLAVLVDRWPGLRLPGAWDGFEVAVRAILGQQVSVKGATTLAGRLARRFGRRPERMDAPELDLLFPGPESLAEADLSGIGLPRARARAINELALAVCEGRVRFDASVGLDRFVREMTSLPGIGDWTAHYVAMRALGDPDAFPSSDLGLVQAMSSPERKITPRELERRAEHWRPWRAYAAIYLWKSRAIRLEEQSIMTAAGG